MGRQATGVPAPARCVSDAIGHPPREGNGIMNLGTSTSRMRTRALRLGAIAAVSVGFTGIAVQSASAAAMPVLNCTVSGTGTDADSAGHGLSEMQDTVTGHGTGALKACVDYTGHGIVSGDYRSSSTESGTCQDSSGIQTATITWRDAHGKTLGTSKVAGALTGNALGWQGTGTVTEGLLAGFAVQRTSLNNDLVHEESACAGSSGDTTGSGAGGIIFSAV